MGYTMQDWIDVKSDGRVICASETRGWFAM